MSRPAKIMLTPGRDCAQTGRGCLVRRLYHLGHPGASPACGFCGVLAAHGRSLEAATSPAAPANHAEAYYSRIDAPGAQPGLAPYLCGMLTGDPLAALRARPTPPRDRPRETPPAARRAARTAAPRSPARPRSRDEALALALVEVRVRVCKADATTLPLSAVAAEFNRWAGECGFRRTTHAGLTNMLRARGIAVYRQGAGPVCGDTRRLREWCARQVGGGR